MTVESFANGILRSHQTGDKRDYILNRVNDPVVEIVASLNRLRVERRGVQSETSECITFTLVKSGAVAIEPTDPGRLQALSEQAKVLSANIAKHQAIIQKLEEFFPADDKDPTMEGLEKRLRTAQTGISRYENSVRNVGISVLSGYKNGGRWNLANIETHPSVVAEHQKADPMIEQYKTTATEMKSKIDALYEILAGGAPGEKGMGEL